MALSSDIKQSIITALKTSLSESVIELVLKRLDSFGCEIRESDTWLIGFSIQKVENTIKNECNISDIPDRLINIEVDMACGEFLLAEKQCGHLEIEGLDLTGAVSSIKEGDTQVNFESGSSDEAKFNSLVNHLLNDGRGELVCYRKIQW